MTAARTYTLPRPPSANNLWRWGRGRMYPTSEYTDWKKHAGLILNTQKPKVIKGPVVVHIEVERPDNRKRDIDNLAKATLDLLKNRAFEDDSNVTRCVAKWSGEGQNMTVKVEAA